MSDNTRPVVEIFVKSSPFNGNQQGPTLVCQQWLMVMRILEQKKLISLIVTPINIDKPAKAYKDLFAARIPPLAWVMSGSVGDKDTTNLTIDSIEKLEAFMSLLGCPYLNPSFKRDDVRKAERVGEDLYNDFMLYLKTDSNKNLMRDLQKLESFLRTVEGPFLLGDELSSADCLLMPKLHHISVVGKVYKKFIIPRDFNRIRSYVRNMYSLEPFTFSCPSVRDMLVHYKEKHPLPDGYRPSLLDSRLLQLSDDEDEESASQDNGSHEQMEEVIHS